MATTRIMPLHIGKGRTESRAISDIIDYVANPQKTDNGKLITSYGCDSRTADAEFLLAKRQYIAATGRVRGTDDVIAYHVRQSFRPGEITPEEANRLGIEFARRFTKGNHSFVVCTHIDKSHIHNHIIWSAVNTDCDRKFRNFWGSTRAVRRLSDTICIENGLSIVEDPKPHGKSYNKWLGEQAKPSHREQLRVMIDRALEQKPADFDALLKLLSEMGCEVSRRGKAIRLKAPGWKNVARMDDKLGAGYSEAEIRAVLAGEKQHIPRKKSIVQPEQPKVNLLVDIQAKLQAGKGAGYARWAKVFNLKQMAQTVNFLTEHQLLDYAELAEKAAAATAHHNELSAQIKAAEKRMAEIAVLRTHITNYAKTRETYVAYRKAGYSRKFRAALFVHAVVLSYALRHPEEFHELCPVPESPALVYHIGSHFQQEPKVIILSPLYDHTVIAVTDPVRIVLAPQYQLLFGTYVLARYAVEVEPVHERIFVYGYSPEKAPHDLFQLVLELHSIYEFRYPWYFLPVYRKVNIAVGYRLYTFADGIRHSPVHEYVLIQVVQFAAQPHVSRPERTFPCAYVVYSPVHGLHQYLIVYRCYGLPGHRFFLPFFPFPVCHKVSV